MSDRRFYPPTESDLHHGLVDNRAAAAIHRERIRAHAKHDHPAEGRPSQERRDFRDPNWLPVVLEELAEACELLPRSSGRPGGDLALELQFLVNQDRPVEAVELLAALLADLTPALRAINEHPTLTTVPLTAGGVTRTPRDAEWWPDEDVDALLGELVQVGAMVAAAWVEATADEADAIVRPLTGSTDPA